MPPRAKIGRPPRRKTLRKLNLLITTTAKRDAYLLATKRGISIGRLFEHLVERAYIRASAGAKAATTREV